MESFSILFNKKNIQVNLKEMIEMVKDNWNINKEKNMKGNLVKIKKKDKVNLFIQTILTMRDRGKMIIKMGMENMLILNHRKCTQGTGNQDNSMDKENIFLKTNLNTQDNLKTAKYLDLEYYEILVGNSIKEIGKIIKKPEMEYNNIILIAIIRENGQGIKKTAQVK